MALPSVGKFNEFLLCLKYIKAAKKVLLGLFKHLEFLKVIMTGQSQFISGLLLLKAFRGCVQDVCIRLNLFML